MHMYVTGQGPGGPPEPALVPNGGEPDTTDVKPAHAGIQAPDTHLQ